MIAVRVIIYGDINLSIFTLQLMQLTLIKMDLYVLLSSTNKIND